MAVAESLSMRTLFKFILPLMGSFMIFALLWGNDQKIWAVLPALLIAMYLGAADIRMEGKHIYYRRFFSWEKLPDDVSDVRCSLLPALGYIRFRHFSPPFGVLFFVVERSSGRFIPFRRTASMQTMVSPSHLRKDEVNFTIERDSKVDKPNRKGRLAGALFPAIGILAGLMVPVPWQQWPSPVNQNLLSHFLQIQHYPSVLGLYVIVLVALTIRNRFNGPISFGLAFLTGTIVAHLTHVR